PMLLCNAGSHPHRYGIARDSQAIDNFDHAFDLADCFGDAARSLLKYCWIVAEQLDLDRLRHSGEIANQVFHQLKRFDLEARNLRFDFA
ncbi:hypothetical protein ABTH45_19390, partial [Acinetobacter baumannii]